MLEAVGLTRMVGVESAELTGCSKVTVPLELRGEAGVPGVGMPQDCRMMVEILVGRAAERGLGLIPGDKPSSDKCLICRVIILCIHTQPNTKELWVVRSEGNIHLINGFFYIEKFL